MDILEKVYETGLKCAAGGRSLDAADLLKKLVYDVRPLKPGYKDLLKAGFEAAPR